MEEMWCARSAVTSFSAYLLREIPESATPPSIVLNPAVQSFGIPVDLAGSRRSTIELSRFRDVTLQQEVDVTDGGKPYLKLHFETIEFLSHVDDASFLPPRDAVGPLGNRVSGVHLVPIDMSSIPQWPASLRQQHFTVKVEIIVGKDGHVISAHAISGPPEEYKACENAVRKWIFKPYLVLDKPVEVEQKVECSNYWNP